MTALAVLGAFLAAAALPAAPPRDSSPATAEAATALLDKGTKARADNNFKSALAIFRAAAEVARAAGAQAQLARALAGAAEALYRLADMANARTTAEEALQAAEASGDLGTQGEAWNTLANVHHARAEFDESLAAARRAGALWEKSGDRRGRARILNNMANIHRVRGDLDVAVRDHGEALRLFEELGDERSAAVVLNALAIDHFTAGDHPRALEYAERSRARADAQGDRYRLATSLDTIGNILRVQGAYARSLDFHHRSLALRTEFGDRFAVLESWNNIGLTHFAHGDYRLAIEAYKRGLRLTRETGTGTLVPEALYNIGAAAWRLGERRRAQANYRESLRAAERIGYPTVEGACMHDLGRMALEDGRRREAEALLTRSLEVRRGAKDRGGVAESQLGLGALRLAEGRPQDALAHAREAAEIARTYHLPELQWEAQTLIGRARRAQGDTEEARRAFQAAIAVIEDLRLQLAGREHGRERFFETKLAPYHELMTLALERGADVEALEQAERSKARVLADLARSGHADLARSMSAEEKREEDHLRTALAGANRKLEAERAREVVDAGRLAALEEERQDRRSTYETFEAALFARHADLKTQRADVAPFSLAEAERLLPDSGTAILEYAVTERESYLFVLTRGDEGVRLDRYGLGAGRSGLAALARRYRARIAARDLAFAEDARLLHRRLLGPAAARLAGRTRLVIVPDGVLWEVPFQALQDAQGRYLVEAATVAYAPSLTVLREILARRPARSGPPTVLAMGSSDVGPLPEAEQQVRLIAGLYGPERSAAYLGSEAREDRFKAEAPRHRILHLATHGVLDEASPLYSHVVLSPGGKGSSEDGLLEAWEIATLSLDADLAVLAACETGRGRVAPGEGIVGTMWAFFVAGTQSLVVSQWKVEAASTTELMAGLHRGLAQGAGDAAGHLRRASLELMRDPRYAHPFYWAGFVLVGHPY